MLAVSSRPAHLTIRTAIFVGDRQSPTTAVSTAAQIRRRERTIGRIEPRATIDYSWQDGPIVVGQRFLPTPQFLWAFLCCAFWRTLGYEAGFSQIAGSLC